MFSEERSCPGLTAAALAHCVVLAKTQETQTMAELVNMQGKYVLFLSDSLQEGTHRFYFNGGLMNS